ncbi:hypothetical protein SO802_031532 [Lithocarpus litseifolius]|uniref:Uncharacterized protein n=1 Tax=Lithocarpus litseifolius TaxID=425828 RepID=A0AAW2BKK0_9ROSI
MAASSPLSTTNPHPQTVSAGDGDKDHSNVFQLIQAHQGLENYKDLTVNPKCSLLVARDPEDRTDLVITLHGDGISISVGYLLIIYTPKTALAGWLSRDKFQASNSFPRRAEDRNDVKTLVVEMLQAAKPLAN